MAKGKNYTKTLIVALVIVVVAAFAVIGLMSQSFNVPGPLGNEETDSEGVLKFREEGASATIGINAFTGDWGGASTQTEVYPAYTIYDGEGSRVHSDVNVNSTTSFSVGDTMSIFGTGSSYYLDKVDYTVTSQAGSVPDLEVYEIAASTDLVITVFDKDQNALTADDNSNNTADYASGDLGADDLENYYVRLEQTGSDKSLRLGAILTYYCGDEMDDFSLVQSGWKEANIPTTGDLDTNFLLYDNTNATTTCTIKKAYVPSDKEYIELKENQDTGFLKFTAETDSSSAPAADGDSYFGVVFVDYACETDSKGKVACGWYRSDEASLPGGVGLNEAVTTTGFKGLDVGAAIEAQ